MPSARHLPKIALCLLVAVTGFITSASAQQEVQIMVNGPWAYAATPTPTPLPNPSPTPTIFIVAPMSQGHGPVVIFPGEQANLYSSARNPVTISGVGQYTLEIPSLANTCGTIKISNDDIPQKAYLLKVDSGLVQTAVKGGQGFSISLPTPCYATTMTDNYSKIDNNFPPKTKEGSYTSWMVLHYAVNSIDNITINKIPVAFQSIDGQSTPAISIAMGPTNLLSDLKCDSLSVASFLDEASLFGQTLHVHFPSLLPPDPGVQTHKYIPGCADKKPPAFFLQLLADIDKVDFYLIDPHPNQKAAAKDAFTRIQADFGPLKLVDDKIPAEVIKEVTEGFEQKQKGTQLTATKAYVEHVRTAAGAGDCRGAQLNINGTLQ